MTTDPARWQRISQLFEAALACEARERSAFLADACGGDDSLRCEVESLLAHATADGFMEAPVVVVAASMMNGQPRSLIGRQLGSYRILSLIGMGGMGEVYRARDIKLGRDVAIKVLPHIFTADPERLRRFEREARLLATLNHPHIGAIYGFEEAEGMCALILELVEGPTLADRLTRGALPQDEALAIGCQIAEAMEAAHEKGVVHRDLKPANIKMTADGTVKVLDFGLAKAATGDADGLDLSKLPTVSVRATHDGIILGTAGYMSPEQARGQVVDKHADIWAFGCVVYEMLAGRVAFPGETLADTLAAVLQREPDWAQLPDGISPSIRRLLRRCLEKDPKHRTRDMGDVRIELEEVNSSRDVAVADAGGRTTWPRRAAWLVVATLMLAAVGLMVRRMGEPPVQMGRPVRFTIAAPENVTFNLGIASSPFAVSPDGHHLVFVGLSTEGMLGLWLHSFDSLVSRPLPGTEGARAPFWSPDGLAVGFFTPNLLKRISISGGDATPICEVSFGGGGTWNRDDVIVFAPRNDSALFRVAATGGTPTPVTVLDAAVQESAHLGPLFLPDGRHFLFGVVGGDKAGTYVAALDSSERKRLSLESAFASTYGLSSPDFLFFARDRALMAQRLDLNSLEMIGDPIRVAEGIGRLGPSAAFSVSPSGTLVYWAGSWNITQPTWFKRDGTPAGTLGPKAAYINIALSLDGKQAAIDRFDQTPGIWLLDAVRGFAKRETFGEIYESTPVWSPDMGSFVFAAARDTPPNLYLKRIGRLAEEKRLFRNAFQTFPQSWSHDGRFVAYGTIEPKTNSDIWVLPLFGDRKPTPLLQTQFDERHARISPDDRWMAYSSTESGSRDVYVTRFPDPGRKWPVSTNGGSFPVWSHDGRELFYRASDGTLMAVPVTPGSDFAPGAPISLFKPLAAVSGLGMGSFYDVAPDGRFLINMLVERTSPPATVVLNWRAGIGPPGK